MKLIIAFFLVIVTTICVGGKDTNTLPINVERAMRICIIQSESFGRAYVIESVNGDLSLINRNEYVKEIAKAKRTLYKEYRDKGLVEHACFAIANVYREKTKDTSIEVLRLCKF